MDNVLAERERIDALVESKTLLDTYDRNVREHGDKPALNWREDGQWRSMAWSAYRDRAREVAAGLLTLGVGHGDFVALMAANRPEHLIADAGAMHAAATPVSIYNTLAPEQIQYVAENCGAKVAVLENRDYMKRWEEIRAQLPALQHIVLMEDAADFAHVEGVLSFDDLMARGKEHLRANPGALDDARAKLRPEDPATLIYTSGTTGPPKGVIITHRNVLWELESTDQFVPLPENGRAISYLPLAHIAERQFSHYLGLHKAGSIYFCPEITQAVEVATVARPTAFVGVPRVWEKMQAALKAAIDAEPEERKRKIAQKALAAGQRAVQLEQQGKSVPVGLKIQRALFDKLVYSKIREKVGLDQCEIALSGAAPIAPDVLEFFAGIGLPIHEVYGMTETTAVTHANPKGAIRIGTVGRTLPGVECRLDDDGEVLVRGGNITAGYYGRPQDTAEAYDSDGWLHTGDLGDVDSDGYLRIVGRKKEIIITAGGKNIAPNNIEGYLKLHPLVGQACVIGDARPFISALIVIDAEVAPVWAAKNGVPFNDIASFSQDERVQAEIDRAVNEANSHLANVEQVKKYVILPTEWTAESEELTPTLKLKRRVILQKYAGDIDGIYA